MSERDLWSELGDARVGDDASDDAVSFTARPRPDLAAPARRAEPRSSAFRSRPRPVAQPGRSRPEPPLQFSIRPPPGAAAEPAAGPAPRARPPSADLQIESPPSSTRSANADTALLFQSIRTRYNLPPTSPSNSASDGGASEGVSGLTRLLEERAASGSGARLRAAPAPYNDEAPAPDGAKRQRTDELALDAGSAREGSIGLFGETAPAEPQFDAFEAHAPDDDGFDVDVNADGGTERGASSVPSPLASPETTGDEDAAGAHGAAPAAAAAAEADAPAEAVSPSAADEYVRPRPRDPNEPEPPIVFEVPVSMVPEIDWLAVALDAEGQVLQQRLEHSESESDSDESVGSVAEMIENDTDAESDGNAEWKPAGPLHEAEVSSGSSESDSDADSFAAATVSESEDSDFTPEVEVQVAELGSRRQRAKRHRIPTVKWWLGERIQYEVEGPLQTLTAVDVRRVVPEKKVYRRRRPYRRRRGPLLPADEDEAEAGRQAVHAPVLGAEDGRFHERTVARSINGLEFEPVHYADGNVMPLVSRCAIFGRTPTAPVQLYVLRIQPGAVYTYEGDVNKIVTFVVWRGRCTAKMNRTDFELQKGMACLVPPANDLYVDNGSTTEMGARGLGEDVFFFATEINARDAPDLAAAMTRDAQSVVSGAATLSRLFQFDANDDVGQGAQSFVSGLHEYSRREDSAAAGDDGPQFPDADDEDDAGDVGGGGGSGLFDDDEPFDMHAHDAAPADTGPADDDVESVAPSLFRELEGDRRSLAGDVSFRAGRRERPRPRPADAREDAPPSFHLERGAIQQSAGLAPAALRAERLARLARLAAPADEPQLRRALGDRANALPAEDVTPSFHLERGGAVPGPARPAHAPPDAGLPRTAAQTRLASVAASEEAPPSFHVGRGGRPPLQVPLASAQRGPPLVNAQRGPPLAAAAELPLPPRPQPAQRAPPAAPRRLPPGREPRAMSDAELDDFFAQVNTDVAGDAGEFTIESRLGAMAHPESYMVNRLWRLAQRPNDTDTQSSG